MLDVKMSNKIFLKYLEKHYYSLFPSYYPPHFFQVIFHHFVIVIKGASEFF